MKSKIILVLIVVLLLVVASSTVVAATADAKAPTIAGAVVPFKAHYQTHPMQTDFDPDTGIITFEIPGEGKATHLGKSTFCSDSWVDIIPDIPPYPQWGTLEFTAANGDKLFGTYEGVVYGEFLGTFLITGGTGRFEGVTGAGEYWGWTDGVIGDLHYVGTLTK